MNQNIKQGVHPNRPEEKKPKKQAAHSCSNGHPKRTEPVWKLLAWTKEDLHLQATKKASTNRRHCEARTVLFSPTKKKKTQGIKTDLKSEAKTRKLRSGTDPYLVRMILPSLASKEGRRENARLATSGRNAVRSRRRSRWSKLCETTAQFTAVGFTRSHID
jgi:hypothetical protein